jgi:hypothetical protein
MVVILVQPYIAWFMQLDNNAVIPFTKTFDMLGFAPVLRMNIAHAVHTTESVKLGSNIEQNMSH